MRRGDRIVRDPSILGGKPTVRGTRISVEQILREIGAGSSTADVLEAHPQLTAADVRAAQSYAADFMAAETIVDDQR